MLIVLLRHGETAYNAQRRYQGKSDIPLSARGKARLRAADFAPDVVVVTALCRTAQTAAAVFPGARQAVEDDLREMDFGDFEAKTYGELKDDPAYRAWLASGGEAACPNGEGKAAFCARVCRAFERLVDEALARGAERLVIEPHRDYYDWNAPLAGGFVLDAAQWPERRVLRVVKTVCYMEEKA